MQEAPAISDWSDDRKTEFWYLLSLRHCKGLGNRYATRLLKKFGSATIAHANFQDWRSIGIPQNIIDEYSSGCWESAATREWDEVLQNNLSVLLWNEQNFPALLKDLPDSPILLYYMGNSDLLISPGIALVGSRNAHPPNLQIARKLAADLSAQGITVISGMAMGIDAAAHEGALPHIGKSIGVLGTGLNIIYPWSNRDLFKLMKMQGLLLSEFPPSTPPTATNFPIRNRIISGLSLAVVVIEAAEKSGSLITAKLALEQNREVFAIPGPAFNIHSIGCQNLIRSGAYPVFCAEDIIRELKPRLDSYLAPAVNRDLQKPVDVKKIQAPLIPADRKKESIIKNTIPDNEQNRIFNFIVENGKTHIDTIGVKLNIEPDILAVHLLDLELSGHLNRLPGGFYEAE